MKMKPVPSLMLFLLLFQFPDDVKAKKEGWNYFFYIAGDQHMKGVTWQKSSSLKPNQNEDQANRMYTTLIRQARSDEKNNYAIFYDPKGKSHWLSKKKHVKFMFFSHGELIHQKTLKEIDMTSEKPFLRLFQKGEKYLDSFHSRHNLFYYGGEHVQTNQPETYDLSHPKSYFSPILLIHYLKQFQKVTRESWDSMIINTCANSSFSFVNMIFNLKLTSWLVLPKINSPKGAPNIQMLKKQYIPKELSSHFQKKNNGIQHYRFDFRTIYSVTFQKFKSKLRRFEIYSSLFAKSFEKLKKDLSFQKRRKRYAFQTIHSIRHEAIIYSDPSSQEVYLDFPSFLNFASRSIESKQTLRQFYNLLKKYKNLIQKLTVRLEVPHDF